MLDARGIELNDGDIVMRATVQGTSFGLSHSVVLCEKLFSLGKSTPYIVKDCAIHGMSGWEPIVNTYDSNKIIKIDNPNTDELYYRKTLLTKITQSTNRFISKKVIEKSLKLLEKYN